jgi:hypothetical protein
MAIFGHLRSPACQQKDRLQQTRLAGIIAASNQIYAAQLADFEFSEDAIVPDQ